MPASDQDLVQRLQERHVDRERATDGGIHPRKPMPPVAAKALKATERTIGVELPGLLRAIYLKVGNGGDCAYQKLPIVLWDSNNLDADLLPK